MTRMAAVLIAGLLATPVLAEGDAEKGKKEFNKCRSCHMIVADDGTEIFKGAGSGPNLYGVVGRQAGTRADFGSYGDSLVAAGEAGLVWDEESFVTYVADPRKFLREYLDDSKAKSGMSFRLRRGGEDVWAYLVSVSPEPAAAEETATD